MEILQRDNLYMLAVFLVLYSLYWSYLNTIDSLDIVYLA